MPVSIVGMRLWWRKEKFDYYLLYYLFHMMDIIHFEPFMQIKSKRKSINVQLRF